MKVKMGKETKHHKKRKTKLIKVSANPVQPKTHFALSHLKTGVHNISLNFELF